MLQVVPGSRSLPTLLGDKVVHIELFDIVIQTCSTSKSAETRHEPEARL